MIILDQIHGKLSRVLYNLFVDTVLCKGLLHQNVPTVFFISQDAPDLGNIPLCSARRIQHLLLFQAQPDHPQACSLQILIKDAADSLCLIRIYLWISSVIQIIPIELLEINGSFSLFHSLPLTPPDIGADRFTFRLGEGTHEGDNQFRVRFQRIDILLLKNDVDSHTFQCTNVLQAVQRIPRKPGNGLCQNQVDFLLAAPADHPVEIIPVFGGRPRNTLVRENACHCPLGIGHDFVRVISTLRFIAGLLFFLLCGYPAVSCHPQPPHDRPMIHLRFCRYDRYCPANIIHFVHPFPRSGRFSV